MQAIPPNRTYKMFKAAYDHNTHDYAVMNVSNVREFILGIEASTEMLWNTDGFEASRYLQHWCSKRFQSAPEETFQAYRSFFDCYPLHENMETPFTLDGLLRIVGYRTIRKIKLNLQNKKLEYSDTEKLIIKRLADGYPHLFMTDDEYWTGLKEKIVHLETTTQKIKRAEKKLSGKDFQFFCANLKAQQIMLVGLARWLNAVFEAHEACEKENLSAGIDFLKKAIAELKQVDEGKKIASRGKWKHWYKGDKKMNIYRVKKSTEDTIKELESAFSKRDQVP